MTLLLIGLGLNKNSISAEALKKLKNCKTIYLENYTVNFPYTIEQLEKELKQKITQLNRSEVEGLKFLDEAKEKDIVLLVYGDPLSATTHITIIQECQKQKIKYKIFHNASILTAIAETGLQPYKFGKTTSMPNWKEHTNQPTSFTDYIQQNQSIKAHTLILIDIDLEIKEAINQLNESIILKQKIIAISNAGTKRQKIFYDNPKKLSTINIPMPFCLIVPTKLHFLEEKYLNNIKQ
jgi:diphthine synthase